MKHLQDLAQVAQEMLSGLHADGAMRERILLTHSAPLLRRQWALRAMPMCAAALVLVAGVTLGLRATRQTAGMDGVIPIENHSAGEATSDPSMTQAMLDVPKGGVHISNQSGASAFNTLFASGDNGNFPLVGYNGNAYRMLTSPGSLGEGALGESLGAIGLYTPEPALADANAWYGLLSNIAEEGSPVYAVAGLPSSTAVAASVGGQMRLFQRIGFADYGAGGGSLENVLDVRGNVAWLDLSGVGRIDDANTANALMSLLLDSAAFQGDGIASGNQSLTIGLYNGLSLQLLVSQSTFSSCGAWSSQEFLDAFVQTISPPDPVPEEIIDASAIPPEADFTQQAVPEMETQLTEQMEPTEPVELMEPIPDQQIDMGLHMDIPPAQGDVLG